MAIDAPQTAPNWATGDYHRINRVVIVCNPLDPAPRYEVQVGFYVSEEARLAGADPVYNRTIDIPFSESVPDPRGAIYALLMQTDLFSNTNARSDEAAQ